MFLLLLLLMRYRTMTKPKSIVLYQKSHNRIRKWDKTSGDSKIRNEFYRKLLSCLLRWYNVDWRWRWRWRSVKCKRSCCYGEGSGQTPWAVNSTSTGHTLWMWLTTVKIIFNAPWYAPNHFHEFRKQISIVYKWTGEKSVWSCKRRHTIQSDIHCNHLW